MRISWVTETWPPEVNGVALTAARAVGFLRQRGHALEVVRPRQGPGDTGERGALLVPGVRLPMYPQLRCGLPVGRRLVQHWRRKTPDLVHIATEGPLGWAAMRAAHSLSLPVTTDFRTRFDRYGEFYGLRVAGRKDAGASTALPGAPGSSDSPKFRGSEDVRLGHGGRGLVALIGAYLRHFHNRALCTFVPTLEMLQELERKGFRNLVLNGRGVDTALFDPRRRDPLLRARWGVVDGVHGSAGSLASATSPALAGSCASSGAAAPPVLLHVGRLAREKNVDLVFSAWRRLHACGVRAPLVVVGDGPLRGALERAHPEAIFTGTLSGPLLAAHYASADLFLFPSLTETFGNVTLEAMASGLAVVAFGSGAAGAHVRDRISGYLARPGDAAGFIAAAAVLAGDSALRQAVGRAARAVACQQSWDRVLEEFEATLLDARALGVFDDAPSLA